MGNPPPDQAEISCFFLQMLNYDHLAVLGIFVLDQPELDTLLQHIRDDWNIGAQQTVYVLPNDWKEGWRKFVENYWGDVNDNMTITLPMFNEDYSELAVEHVLAVDYKRKAIDKDNESRR
jgi:ADP-glucose pyrophosphorylase